MKKCIVEGCNEKRWARGYCRRHVSLFYSHGKIPDKTRLDPNDIIIKNDIAFIVLRDTRGNETAKAIIDSSDVKLARKYKWYLSNNGYAITRINRKKQLFLHRLIMNPPNDMQVDHINRNKLDNRRCNLRICTHQQNLFNTKIRSDNTSGVTGVSFDNKREKWRARIYANKKDMHLGYFDTFEDAVIARYKAEKKYFGDFRNKTIDSQIISLVVSEADKELRVEVE